MPVRRVVVGIVYLKEPKGPKFLVLHRRLLWEGWEFPKGGIERTDPTEESALLRELKEETGMEKLRIISKIPYEIKYKYPPGYGKKFKYTETAQSVYIVRAFTDDVKTSVEHDRFRWLPYEEALEILTHDGQKKALEAALKYIET